MIFAKLITEATIDEITELNHGLRPVPETLNDNTFFVYTDVEKPEFFTGICSRRHFEKMFRWLDVNSEDNIVVQK